jgi:hypothetical protein
VSPFRQGDARRDHQRASPKTGLKRVHLGQRAGQIFVIFAVLAAKLLDRRQLRFGEIVLALDDIGFPRYSRTCGYSGSSATDFK